MAQHHRLASLPLTGFVLAVALAVAPPAAAKTADRPNIVFILADDLSWMDLGCYGNTFHETPRIDRLAAQGLRFTSCYAQAACRPTRVSILTGKNPNRLHNLHGRKQPFNTIPWDKLPPDEITFAEVLVKRGYTTGYVGKWGVRHPEDNGPIDQGFQHVYCNQQPYYLLPNYRFPYGNHLMEELKNKGDVGHLIDYMTDRAVEFIRDNRKRPFLLFLSHFAVHFPIHEQGKPEKTARYREKAERLGVKRNADYAALIESLDESTGRILDTLDELGLKENTAVFFLSDNGGATFTEQGARHPITSNKPLRGKKATIYEGGIRVPFIVRWPGQVDPGTVSDALVTMEDIYPTFLDIAGANIPGKQAVDGFTLKPLLTGEGTTARQEVFLQWQGVMMRRGRYKLIEHFPNVPTEAEIKNARKNKKRKKKKLGDPKPASHSLELYDLRVDIGETNNLAEAMPELTAELRKRLHNWLIEMHGKENYSLERVQADARALGQEFTAP